MTIGKTIFAADQPVTRRPFRDRESRRILDRYRWRGFQVVVPRRFYDDEQAENDHGSVRWYKGVWKYGYGNLTQEGKALFDALAAINEITGLHGALWEIWYAWKWRDEFADFIRFEFNTDHYLKLMLAIEDAFKSVYGENVEFVDVPEALPE